MEQKIIVIGNDIGGGHISSAAVDLLEKKVIMESLKETPVDSNATKETIFRAWEGNIASCFKNYPSASGFGFAMPGPFDYVKGIGKFDGSVKKYQALYDVDVAKELREILRLDDSVPIRFMNDATSFAVGESEMGASAKYRRSLHITLGTGLGSAFIEDGIPVVEGRQVPEKGCVYHLAFKNGNADDYCSSRWLVNSYRERSKYDIRDVKDIMERAEKGDLEARGVFSEFGHNLADILSPWVKDFSAEALVVGGKIRYADRFIFPELKKRFSENGIEIPVILTALGDYASIAGSAKLLDKGFWNEVRPLLKYM